MVLLRLSASFVMLQLIDVWCWSASC